MASGMPSSCRQIDDMAAAVCRSGVKCGSAARARATNNATAACRSTSIVQYVANLVTKSLVAADIEGGAVRDWLLDTTRAYAREKLTERGELEQTARRHAEYYLALCARSEEHTS